MRVRNEIPDFAGKNRKGRRVKKGRKRQKVVVGGSFVCSERGTKHSVYSGVVERI